MGGGGRETQDFVIRIEYEPSTESSLRHRTSLSKKEIEIHLFIYLFKQYFYKQVQFSVIAGLNADIPLARLAFESRARATKSKAAGRSLVKTILFCAST